MPFARRWGVDIIRSQTTGEIVKAAQRNLLRPAWGYNIINQWLQNYGLAQQNRWLDRPGSQHLHLDEATKKEA